MKRLFLLLDLAFKDIGRARLLRWTLRLGFGVRFSCECSAPSRSLGIPTEVIPNFAVVSSSTWELLMRRQTSLCLRAKQNVRGAVLLYPECMLKVAPGQHGTTRPCVKEFFEPMTGMWCLQSYIANVIWYSWITNISVNLKFHILYSLV